MAAPANSLRGANLQRTVNHTQAALTETDDDDEESDDAQFDVDDISACLDGGNGNSLRQPLLSTEGAAIPKIAAWYVGVLLGIIILGFGVYAAVTRLLLTVSGEHIYYNGSIHTVDPRIGHAEAFLVVDGIFRDVGSAEDLKSKYVGARLIDLQGKTVVPGFTDAHAHLMRLGFSLLHVDLRSATSAEDMGEIISRYVKERRTPYDANRWLIGFGWDQTKWPGGNFPSASDLDEIPGLREVPMMLSRVDGHACLVNSRVISLVGSLPRAVEGGEIVRNSAGEPTGVFLDNAMDLIKRVQPPPTEEAKFEALDAAIRKMHSVGLTGIHDAMVTPEEISFFFRAIKAAKFDIRSYSMISCPDRNTYCGDLQHIVRGAGNGRLTLRAVKMVMDGALGSWGAALLEPYSDDNTKSGFLVSDPARLPGVIDQWITNGYQVNVHCIGDKANRLVLDAFEENIRRRTPPEGNAQNNNLRLRIEHAQILSPSDIPRFAQLGVIPSMQPTHATSDMWYAEERLGKDRIKGAYAWKSLVNTSIPALPLGSDFPVEDPNPLSGFYAAVTRLSRNGTSPQGSGGWYPEQRLTREEALRGFTLDAAYAAFQEDELGSISPGKRADFVVLDQDPMTVPDRDIPNIRIHGTWFNGNRVYGSE